MKPILLFYLTGYQRTTLRFNAFRCAEIKRRNHVCASSLNCTTLLGVRRGVLGVLGVLQSTLLPENRIPDLELLLVRMALCWPRGNAGYKWNPHQSRTPARQLYDLAPQKAGFKAIGFPDIFNSWDGSMPARGGWSRINCGR